jgi:hypothetical protein
MSQDTHPSVPTVQRQPNSTARSDPSNASETPRRTEVPALAWALDPNLTTDLRVSNRCERASSISDAGILPHKRTLTQLERVRRLG